MRARACAWHIYFFGIQIVGEVFAMFPLGVVKNVCVCRVLQVTLVLSHYTLELSLIDVMWLHVRSSLGLWTPSICNTLSPGSIVGAEVKPTTERLRANNSNQDLHGVRVPPHILYESFYITGFRLVTVFDLAPCESALILCPNLEKTKHEWVGSSLKIHRGCFCFKRNPQLCSPYKFPAILVKGDAEWLLFLVSMKDWKQ